MNEMSLKVARYAGKALLGIGLLVVGLVCLLLVLYVIGFIVHASG